MGPGEQGGNCTTYKPSRIWSDYNSINIQGQVAGRGILQGNKQNLRINTFVGTSPNALMTQIWTALIAILILKYLKVSFKVWMVALKPSSNA